MEVHCDLPSAFPDHLRWHTVPIPRHKAITGYVAGPFFGTQVHWVSNRSRPCLDVLTRGAEACPLCPNAALREVVYLPIYSMLAHERLVVILSRTTFLTIQHAKFGHLFAARQADTEKSAALAESWKPRASEEAMPAHLRKEGPQSIVTYLLHLWGLGPKRKTIMNPAKKVQSQVPTADGKPDQSQVDEVRRIIRENIARSVGRDPNKVDQDEAA